jgi:hypothetical protein
MASKLTGDGLQSASGTDLQLIMEAAAAQRRVAALVTRGASPRETLAGIAS